MKRLFWTLAVLGFAFILTTGQTMKESQNIPQWEYKFEFSGAEKKANDLGSRGWELVAIQSTGPGLGNNIPTYVFKRAKQVK